MMTRRDQESAPHAKNLRGGRFSGSGQIYSITKCIEGRRPILEDPRAATIVVRSLAHVRGQNAIKLLAFVIMPDHYHALLALLPGEDLSRLMRRIGSFSANQIRAALNLRAGVWQREGFYDRACRDDAEVLALAEYIHHNPVRKGLVLRAEDWPYSSAHPSQRYLLDWDEWLP
jgi:REP element-mobilizing transposase RayT